MSEHGRTALRVAVGARVRALREREGLTVAQLAQRLGWARTAMYAAENGDRAWTVDDVAAVADHFGVARGEIVE